ncbi:ATP-grasp domain-containing protein [Arthrobacter sp. AK01]|uniref:ATP-grasp domain-containing protein n=1 Tax=Micrococcaceae TaxID=1268 RepID=UPI001E3EFBB6|nr:MULTISPECIES: ATP-grasp domain-containing protein [Micrococcaceae]MCD4852222.1 ATP-grasp domain-containing protein [Arthrobacter sp. AK01]MCP1412456.1 carbamoyl-phosphate synthase large subunit [Paenarthrobacter sp. A20]
MARVLVTGICGPAGSSLARQLKSRGHWVLGADAQRARPSGVDAAAVVSPPQAPGYLWELRGLVANYGIEILIPTISEELVLMSEARNDFAPGVEVLIADPASVRTANDRYLTMTCLGSAGVGVPGFGLPSAFGSVQDAMDKLGGPLVVKPRVSLDGRNVRLLERTSDGGARAEGIWAGLDDTWLVQRVAPGTEYAVVVHRCGLLADPDDLLVGLEKEPPPAAWPGGFARVRKVETNAEPDVARLAASAAAALGLTGALAVDVRRMRDGRPVVLEIEARFSAYSAFVPQLLDNVLMRCSQGLLSN